MLGNPSTTSWSPSLESKEAWKDSVSIPFGQSLRQPAAATSLCTKEAYGLRGFLTKCVKAEVVEWPLSRKGAGAERLGDWFGISLKISG